MGRQQMPIGTIRHWQGGDVIKAGENNIFHSGWITLQTSETLESIGRDCDSKANIMLTKKKPINGELFLDHEINNFEKDEQGNHPFKANDFKAYEGFYGAGRYSFRNEFSKRFMADKIKLHEDIMKELLEENEDQGGNNNGDNKKIVLSSEEISKIKKSVKAKFKFTERTFTSDDARKLQGIVTRTYNQLLVGVDFTDPEQKETYNYALQVSDELPKKYERIGIKRKLYNETLEAIDKVFDDNWGVRESVKKILDEKYDEYVKKYSKEISDDEAKDQEETFGVKLDDDVETFYKGLFKKVEQDKKLFESLDLNKYEGKEILIDERVHLLKKDKNGKFYFILKKTYDEEQKSGDNWQWAKEFIDGEDNIENKDKLLNAILQKENKYPFKELIYLRFETLYGKHLDGDWHIGMLPVIYNLERIINELPKGHFLTNQEVLNVINKGTDKGYACYIPDAKEINFSKQASNEFQVWGDLKAHQEFNAVCTHEIGHAVSQKFGRSGNVEYKKFVVACGWSYQYLKMRGDEHATGDDQKIQRTGSNSMTHLLTEYAETSPEEAFAEYYSIYFNNREAIDKWLDTNNTDFLNKKSQLVVSKKKVEHEKIVYDMLRSPEKNKNKEIEEKLDELNIKADDKVNVDIINPWHVKYTRDQEKEMHENKMRGINEARQEIVSPVIVVKNKLNDYTCINYGSTNEGCKYTKKFVPAIVIDNEVYHHLKENNFTDVDIRNYVINLKKDEKIPIQDSQPKFKQGLEYRNNILDKKDVIANRERLEIMRRIFHSQALAKALGELFSIDKLRGIFSKPTVLVNEEGIEEELLKAKFNVLLNEYQESDKKVVDLKDQIDRC